MLIFLLKIILRFVQGRSGGSRLWDPGLSAVWICSTWPWFCGLRWPYLCARQWDARGEQEEGAECPGVLSPKKVPSESPDVVSASHPLCQSVFTLPLFNAREGGRCYPLRLSTCPDKFRGLSPWKKGRMNIERQLSFCMKGGTVRTFLDEDGGLSIGPEDAHMIKASTLGHLTTGFQHLQSLRKCRSKP